MSPRRKGQVRTDGPPPGGPSIPRSAPPAGGDGEHPAPMAMAVPALRRISALEHGTAGAASLALSLLLLLPYSIRPLEGDFAMLAYIGDRLAQGDRLYVDVWDNKPPLRPLLDSLAIRVFGRSALALTMLMITSTWLAMWALWRMGTALCGPWAGAAAAWLYLLSVWGLQTMAIQAEGLAAAPLAWAFALAIPSPMSRSRAVVAGVLLAMAAGIKLPLGIFVLPWIVLAGIGRRLLWAAAGFAGLMTAVVAWLAWQGAFAEAFYALTTFATSFAAARQDIASQFFQQIPHMAGGLWLVVAGSVAGVAIGPPQGRARYAFRSAVIVAALLVAGQRTFIQYQWLPLYLFSAAGFGALMQRLAQGGARWRRLAVVAVLLALWIPRPADAVAAWSSFIGVCTGRLDRLTYAAAFPTSFGDPPASYADLERLASRLQATTSPEAYIWSFLSPPFVTFHAQRREPTRFFYPDGLFIPHPRHLQWQQEQVRDVLKRRPDYILVPRQFLLPGGGSVDLMRFLRTEPRLSQLLDREYELDQTLPGLDVYRRTDEQRIATP